LSCDLWSRYPGIWAMIRHKFAKSAQCTLIGVNELEKRKIACKYGDEWSWSFLVQKAISNHDISSLAYPNLYELAKTLLIR
jgi:hypothetical protein